MRSEKNTFRKSEHLKRKLLIQEVFSNGDSHNAYPYRLLYKEAEVPSNYPAQLGISVPKKRKKNATDRNRIKRYVREAYRKNKHDLYQALENEEKQYILFIIYIGKDDVDYAKTEEKIIVLLQSLVHKLSKNNN